MGRYTIHQDPQVDAVVEAHLGEIVTAVRDVLGADLLAVLLCGGFGRGEGSVVIDPDTGPRPLNDYDLTLVTRGSRGHGERLEPTRRALEDRFLVQVDLGVVDGASLRNAEPSILVYELREGHELLWGEAEQVRFPRFGVAELPLEEGTDLLFNRGMSLLQSRVERAEGWPGRSRGQCSIHIQKALQAMGDAALLAAGRYVLSYRERMALISGLNGGELPPVSEFASRYGSAVERKLLPRPGDPDPEESEGLDEAIASHEATFRWYEERRTGVGWESWEEYRGSPIRKTARPRRARNRLLNPLRNLRRFGASALRRALFRSPKEPFVAAFPSVLYGPEAEGDQALRELGIDGGGVSARKEYVHRWHG